MKMLYITTIARAQFGGFIRSSIEAAKNAEIEYHVAANETGVDQVEKDAECKKIGVYHHHIDIQRSPFAISKNIKAYHQLVKLMSEEHFDMIHCNTPMGGVLGRLAAHKVGIQKIIYQAHGFHFWKGAPLKNWLMYYPVEKLLARYTDLLITINQEDFAFAHKKLKAKKVIYIPGVGIDLKRFGIVHTDKVKKRQEIGVPDGNTWILSVGELIPRKNFESLIRAIEDVPNVYLTIAGRGEQMEYLNTLVSRLGMQDKVSLLGFRSDISELCEAADIFAFPTYQEGLPIAVMEAMACAKPIVCSAVRGNIDLVDDKGGELFDPHDIEDIKNAIERVMKRDWTALGSYNAEKIRKFDMEEIVDQMTEMYSAEIFGGGYKRVAEMIKRYELRKSIGCSVNDTLLISVGEVNKNKNHAVVIQALALLGRDDIHYAVLGKGEMMEKLRILAKQNGVEKTVHFVGFSTEVKAWLDTSDIFVFPSFREGLAGAVMEAMACRKPVICSRIRGNTDLICENSGGLFFDPNNSGSVADAIVRIEKMDWLQMGDMNAEQIKNFSIDKIAAEMTAVYRS